MKQFLSEIQNYNLKNELKFYPKLKITLKNIKFNFFKKVKISIASTIKILNLTINKIIR